MKGSGAEFTIYKKSTPSDCFFFDDFSHWETPPEWSLDAETDTLLQGIS